MTAVKHDQFKPAFHLIDWAFRDAIKHEMSTVEVSCPLQALRVWTFMGDLTQVSASFSGVAYLFGTRSPRNVAELELARVLAHGRAKYPAEPGQLDNWRQGLKWSQYWRAAYGHIRSHLAGDLYDPESGLMHLSHALGNLMFLYVSQRDSLGTDDRTTVWPPSKTS